MNKISVRKEIIEQRRNLKQSQKLKWDYAINEELINLLKDFGVRSVMGFYPKNEEVNLVPFLEFLLENEIELYLPKINNNKIDVYRVLNLENLSKNSFGILEPTDTKNLNKDYIFDLIVVPGVAFNQKNGHRIGYGKGFYDSFLKQSSGLKVGVAYEMQILSNWEAESFDVPVDLIITESGSYKI